MTDAGYSIIKGLLYILAGRVLGRMVFPLQSFVFGKREGEARESKGSARECLF